MISEGEKFLDRDFVISASNQYFLFGAVFWFFEDFLPQIWIFRLFHRLCGSLVPIQSLAICHFILNLGCSFGQDLQWAQIGRSIPRHLSLCQKLFESRSIFCIRYFAELAKVWPSSRLFVSLNPEFFCLFAETKILHLGAHSGAACTLFWDHRSRKIKILSS